MNFRSVACLVVVLVWVGVFHGAPAAAQQRNVSIDCIPDRSCPAGQAPPACCQPPPCEYYQQLEGKKILKRAHENQGLRKRLMTEARNEYLRKHGKTEAQLGPQDRDIIVADATAKLVSYLNCASMPKADRREYVTNSYRQAKYGDAEGPLTPEDQAAINREVAECEKPPDLFKSLRPCPTQQNTKIANPPGFSTAVVSCQIEDQDGPLSREGAHRKYATCKEFIDAAYEHEMHHKNTCFRTNSSERGKAGIDDLIAEEAEGYRREIEYLENQLEGWVSACSPAMDAQTRREMVRKGIGAFGKGGGK